MQSSLLYLVACLLTFVPFASQASSPPPPAENTTAFNIALRFEVPTDDTVKEIFYNASNRWGAVIVGDVETQVVIQQGQELCGKTINETEYIDDLLIFVNVQNIDGVGNVLANAGPCGIDSQGRVRVGQMNFDLADIQRLISLGRAGTVVLHEMGHVLGIGTLWDSNNLIDTHGFFFHTYRYTGDNGNQGNEQVGMSGEAVIENEGGEGTAKSHWKEKVYTTELMTGYVTETGPSPMSVLTILSLADLGYTVDTSQADPFKVDQSIADDYNDDLVEPAKSNLRGGNGKAASQAADGREMYGNDVLKFPIVALDEIPKPKL